MSWVEHRTSSLHAQPTLMKLCHHLLVSIPAIIYFGLHMQTNLQPKQFIINLDIFDWTKFKTLMNALSGWSGFCMGKVAHRLVRNPQRSFDKVGFASQKKRGGGGGPVSYDSAQVNMDMRFLDFWCMVWEIEAKKQLTLIVVPRVPPKVPGEGLVLYKGSPRRTTCTRFQLSESLRF